MSEICKCLVMPIYDGGGEWHCPTCRAEYDEEEFNSKVLWLRDREIETLRAKVAELEAGSEPVAEVILIFDKTDKTFVRDTDELMKLAGLNPGMGYEAVGMQDDGTSVVFDRCGNFGYLDERYSPVITTPQPVKVPEGCVTIPVDELKRLRNVLAYAAHPCESPHAKYIDDLLAAQES